MKRLLSPSAFGFLLSVFLVGILPPSAQSQTLALAHQQQNRQTARPTPPPKNEQRLKDKLNALSQQFSVNILFEERIVQNITVAPDQAVAGKRLDKQLMELLNPLGLTYKKTGPAQYVVFQKKSRPADQALEESVRESTPDATPQPFSNGSGQTHN